MLDVIWITMSEAFGSKFTSQYGEDPAENSTWARALAGFPQTLISNGLEVLMNLAPEWPPNAFEFRHMCLQISGCPSKAAGWLEALKGVYSHPIIEAAAKLTGTNDLRAARLSDSSLQHQFDRNYDIVCRRFRRNLPLDTPIAAGIGHDGSKTELQAAEEAAERAANAMIDAQGVPRDAKAARALLLASMGINRT